MNKFESKALNRILYNARKRGISEDVIKSRIQPLVNCVTSKGDSLAGKEPCLEKLQ